MYRGVLPVRAIVRGPVRSRIHFFLGLSCEAACLRFFRAQGLHAVFFLRRTPQAVRLQVHASESTRRLTALPDPRSRAVRV